MQKPEDFTAKLIELVQVSPKVKVLIFEADRDLNYIPGQFLNLKFQDPFGEEGQIQRAYSIASAPKGREFELCIEIVPGGKGSNYVDSLKLGDEIQFKAPFGHCIIKDNNQADLLMVATGTGIAPIKAILEDLARTKDTRRIEVYFGLRYEEDIFFTRELAELTSLLPNLKTNISLSKPNETWTGPKGRVTEHLAKYDFSHQPDLYLCGSMAMIKDVMNLAKENGIDRKKIHVEIYG